MNVNAITNFKVSTNYTTNQNTGNRFVTSPLNNDSVSFEGKSKKTQPLHISMEKAEQIANALSHSTSGYRAAYGTENFNRDIVEALTTGVADYAINIANTRHKRPVVMVGGDTRIATKEMIPVISGILSKRGIEVLVADAPVPTPIFAQAAKDRAIPLSILMTASHNPWTDGGYNLVTDEGAIAPPSVTEHIAKYIIAAAQRGEFDVKNPKSRGKINVIDFYPQYAKDLDNLTAVNINWDKIRSADAHIYYDGLKGTGNHTFPRLMRDHGIGNVIVIDSGDKTGPNPNRSNLKELGDIVRTDNSKLVIGLANDGDADRFGVVDELGNFITPNDVILLTAYHLYKNKGLKGTIIRSQATTGALDQFALNKGIKVIQTPVGFKYIGEDIVKERNAGRDILVAGEESGGLTVAGHIPEKDGILAISLMLDLLAEEGKPISEILKDAKSDMDSQVNIISDDRTYKPGEKDKVMKKIENCYNQAIYGDSPIVRFSKNFFIDIEKTKENERIMKQYKKGGDGFKFYLTDGSTILLRKSGTEDKIKEYIELISGQNESKQDIDCKLYELKEAANKLLDPTF